MQAALSLVENLSRLTQCLLRIQLFAIVIIIVFVIPIVIVRITSTVIMVTVLFGPIGIQLFLNLPVKLQVIFSLPHGI